MYIPLSKTRVKTKRGKTRVKTKRDKYYAETKKEEINENAEC